MSDPHVMGLLGAVPSLEFLPTFSGGGTQASPNAPWNGYLERKMSPDGSNVFNCFNPSYLFGLNRILYACITRQIINH